MPLIKNPQTFIEVEVADRKINDTTIKQKAVFQTLNYVQLPNGESRVSVAVLVNLYATDNATYGAQLTGNGLQSYRVELVADNNTIVDATTGAILAINTDFKTPTQFEELANVYTHPVMLQGDFFEYIRDIQAINIGDMIRQHIAQADAMGKFA